MKLFLLIKKEQPALRLFEVFYGGSSVLVEAPNEMSAKYRGATLIKLLGFKVNPYMLTASEVNEEGLSYGS